MKNFLYILTILFLSTTSTIAQKLDVEGKIKLADEPMTAPQEGEIRWTGSDFQGYLNNDWCSLTQKVEMIRSCDEPDVVFINGIPFWAANLGNGARNVANSNMNPIDNLPYDKECDCFDGIDNDQDGLIDGQDCECLTDASIISTVFQDSDNNGIFDSGEPLIGDLTINLFKEGQNFMYDNPIATAVTNANGEIQFSSLPCGRFYIYIPNPPIGMSSSHPNFTDDGIDDDDNGSQDDTNNDGIFDGPITSSLITLAQGESKTTIDFGLVPGCVATFECDCFDEIDNDNSGDMDCNDFNSPCPNDPQCSPPPGK